ncbi:MAG: MoaD/ThiS family protein [Actinomycetales bacterium]|nr:MoaD/ThiS family protein [Actinomycetales bacterium]
MARVNLYAAARAAAGAELLEIEASTLGILIEKLTSKSSELAKLLPTCSYLLNGESCEDLNRVLAEGDNIDVLPQFAGG